MIIYADTDVCAYHLEQIGLIYTRNFEQCLQKSGPKIAIFHVPFPWEGGYGDQFVGKIERVRDFQQIIILCSELHNRTYEFIRQNDYSNITYFLCGYLNRRPEKSRVYQWMDWFLTTGKFYKSVPGYLSKLNPYAVKPKSFDVLLGQPRSHRDMVYKLMVNHQDDIILTYMRDFSQGLYDHDFKAKAIQDRPANEYTWDIDGLDISKETINFTIEQIELEGQKISLSQIVPVNIYNQTAYSIVTETNFMNSYTFYTEKTVKPILAERLFVAFSGQHYIRNLHNLGFRTFDNVIDESYDEEPDQQRRYTMAYEQVRYLMSQSQDQIVEEIRSITGYNKRHMMTTDWYGDFTREFQSAVLDHTN